MAIRRTPLLLEGVKKRMRRWEKAHAELERVTAKGYRKFKKRVSAWERRRPEETPEEHAQRLATPSDVEDRVHADIVNEPKMRARLDRARTKEAKRRAALERAEDRKRRKQAVQAVPTLEPTRSRIPQAAVQAAQRVARTRPKKVFTPGLRRSRA
jgi:hypothetical protein